MITFRIDEFTPCLTDASTGEIYDTEVIQIKRKSFLSKFNQKTGWYINWGKFSDETTVYALVLKGTMDIQGMVALELDEDSRAVYLSWGCVAPQNNIWKYGKKRFCGVGGHLIAIASEISVKHGYEGYIVSEAMNRQLLEYYISEFGAIRLPGIDHPYRFMLSDAATQKIREVYNYEWTEDII